MELKREMADRYLAMPVPQKFCRRIPVMRHTINDTTTLTNLIGPNSWFIFESLSVESDWLSLPVEEWKNLASFLKDKDFVTTVKVVNDAAERRVKLNTDYSSILTDDLQQQARLLQNVEQHRKQVPGFSKSILADV